MRTYCTITRGRPRATHPARSQWQSTHSTFRPAVVVLYIWIFSTNKLTSVLLIKQWRSPEWPHPCWRCCARALVWPGRWPPFRPQLSVVSCRVVVVVVSRWRNAVQATVPPCRMSVKWWGIRTFVAVLCCGRFVLFVRFYWFSLSLRSMQWCCYLHNFVSRN